MSWRYLLAHAPTVPNAASATTVVSGAASVAVQGPASSTHTALFADVPSAPLPLSGPSPLPLNYKPMTKRAKLARQPRAKPAPRASSKSWTERLVDTAIPPAPAALPVVPPPPKPVASASAGAGAGVGTSGEDADMAVLLQQIANTVYNALTMDYYAYAGTAKELAKKNKQANQFALFINHLKSTKSTPITIKAAQAALQLLDKTSPCFQRTRAAFPAAHLLCAIVWTFFSKDPQDSKLINTVDDNDRVVNFFMVEFKDVALVVQTQQKKYFLWFERWCFTHTLPKLAAGYKWKPLIVLEDIEVGTACVIVTENFRSLLSECKNAMVPVLQTSYLRAFFPPPKTNGRTLVIDKRIKALKKGNTDEALGTAKYPNFTFQYAINMFLGTFLWYGANTEYFSSVYSDKLLHYKGDDAKEFVLLEPYFAKGWNSKAFYEEYPGSWFIAAVVYLRDDAGFFWNSSGYKVEIAQSTSKPLNPESNEKQKVLTMLLIKQ
jgi:hypothetical protein